MILMKFLPGVPGHFSVYEWIALIAWTLIGLVFGIWEWVTKNANKRSQTH